MEKQFFIFTGKKNMRRYYLFALVLGLCFSCETESKQQEEKQYDFTTMEAKNIEIVDSHSNGNFQDVALRHLHWEADVNFNEQVIYATAHWDIENKTDASKLVLDTRGLDVLSVRLDNATDTQFSLGETTELLGTPLQIDIQKDTKKVSITYKTSPSAEAIQWLTPQQTADKKQPFLFTQSQAILARSWLPCMDGPGVRFTYTADVKVPSDLLALMSAKNPKQKTDSGQYNFEMKQPIPSYLMALSVGDLVYKQLGDVSGVYAEPSVINAAAAEFEDLPKMIDVAEELYGAYRWDEYDIIVLPPSFPFGGMENPRLTFATPTILAGDKSLTSLVAHELAHSWSGNLVTNSNWNDFWLNEGFTVYFEQRIMEELYGRDYSEMLASLSYEGLKSDITELDEKDTHLHLALENRNPDDGMTSIAYDKGYLFLRHIEESIGREKFDDFLKNYFENYGFKVMDTKSFIELLNDEIIQGDEQLEQTLNVEEWIYGPGLPKDHPVPTSTKFAEIDELVTDVDIKQVQTKSKEWSSHEWQHFIESLPRSISKEEMKAFDEAFGFTNSGNSEIQFDWYELAIENNYEEAYPAIEEFLINVGRRKFLTPLYKKMIETDQTDWAKEIYEKARPNYHSVSYNTIDALLN